MIVKKVGKRGGFAESSSMQCQGTHADSIVAYLQCHVSTHRLAQQYSICSTIAHKLTAVYFIDLRQKDDAAGMFCV